MLKKIKLQGPTLRKIILEPISKMALKAKSSEFHDETATTETSHIRIISEKAAATGISRLQLKCILRWVLILFLEKQQKSHYY
ncbi:MAG: hypothetical protein A2909_00405 [Candidatus Tagabacteria bacterium RIFCSPLOWO2_01_FULL_39_11]|uniref:Uncharacterized protein n=1 Tax=Candidatus Tagabacteria bacterium RIFCSPLOWO2_01_FULL_39_11 TaxID=1802295 RepID=A0A1G2LNX5_9BACT|nr:MAG: hypothetical protein A2909_00405 [Candidatus Tagabacteria bacterium RIFCSPLOWO2_01_FULL_39_11]